MVDFNFYSINNRKFICPNGQKWKWLLSSGKMFSFFHPLSLPLSCVNGEYHLLQFPPFFPSFFLQRRRRRRGGKRKRNSKFFSCVTLLPNVTFLVSMSFLLSLSLSLGRRDDYLLIVSLSPSLLTEEVKQKELIARVLANTFRLPLFLFSLSLVLFSFSCLPADQKLRDGMPSSIFFCSFSSPLSYFDLFSSSSVPKLTILFVFVGSFASQTHCLAQAKGPLS